MKIFKFLRIESIRKENIKKYFLYALGEIILIFVGINLAIWFNNWNENKKAKIEEIKTLIELKSGLNDDLNDMTFNIELHRKGERSCEVILDHLENGISYHDSLDYYFGQASWLSTSFPKTGAYQALKMKGIDLITSDEIRLGLSDLYEVQFPYILYAENLDKSNFEIFSDIYKTKFKDWAVFQSATPLNYEALKEDNYFKEQIRQTYFLKSVSVKNSERVKKMLGTTITKIENELDRLE